MSFIKNNDTQAPELDNAFSLSTGSKETKSKSHRRGGPSTEDGRRKSARNSTKHGIYSKVLTEEEQKSPEWKALQKGLRGSYQPVGYLENLYVDQMAINRWKRAKEERWATETLQFQGDETLDFDRSAFERPDLPEDELVYLHRDPCSALVIVEMLLSGENNFVPIRFLRVFAIAFKRATGHALPPVLAPERGAEEEEDLEEEEVITIRKVLASVNQVAEATSRPVRHLLKQTEIEATRATDLQWARFKKDVRKAQMKRTNALVLSGTDLANHERRVKLLDTEYGRLRALLEDTQRARFQTLAPPVRLRIDQS